MFLCNLANLGQNLHVKKKTQPPAQVPLPRGAEFAFRHPLVYACKDFVPEIHRTA